MKNLLSSLLPGLLPPRTRVLPVTTADGHCFPLTLRVVSHPDGDNGIIYRVAPFDCTTWLARGAEPGLFMMPTTKAAPALRRAVGLPASQGSPACTVPLTLATIRHIESVAEELVADYAPLADKLRASVPFGFLMLVVLGALFAFVGTRTALTGQQWNVCRYAYLLLSAGWVMLARSVYFVGPAVRDRAPLASYSQYLAGMLLGGSTLFGWLALKPELSGAAQSMGQALLIAAAAGLATLLMVRALAGPDGGRAAHETESI